MATPKPGGIVHVEISTTDLPATRKFMEGVFGWKFKKEAAGDMEYWTFQAGDGPGGGVMNPMAGMPPSTVAYLLVESVEAAVKKITHAGGKILMPRTEIPKVGWFAVFEVPGGPTAAVFESMPGGMS